MPPSFWCFKYNSSWSCKLVFICSLLHIPDNQGPSFYKFALFFFSKSSCSLFKLTNSSLFPIENNLNFIIFHEEIGSALYSLMMFSSFSPIVLHYFPFVLVSIFSSWWQNKGHSTIDYTWEKGNNSCLLLVFRKRWFILLEAVTGDVASGCGEGQFLGPAVIVADCAIAYFLSFCLISQFSYAENLLVLIITIWVTADPAQHH